METRAWFARDSGGYLSACLKSHGLTLPCIGCHLYRTPCLTNLYQPCRPASRPIPNFLKVGPSFRFFSMEIAGLGDKGGALYLIELFGVDCRRDLWIVYCWGPSLSLVDFYRVMCTSRALWWILHVIFVFAEHPFVSLYLHPAFLNQYESHFFVSKYRHLAYRDWRLIF